MANQARRKDPTRGVSIFFVAVVLLVLAAVLYKAVTGRNEYEAEQRAAQAAAAMPASGSQAGGAGAASAPGVSPSR